MIGLSYPEVVTNQPVVIDNGSGFIKAGFAGVDSPSLLFPTLVGRVKHQRAMAGAIEQDVFVGNKAVAYRGLLRLKYPMVHGMIIDWADIETIWYHVFTEMKINSEEHPVLLTECMLNPYKARERAAEVFFESFNCPAFFISPQAILALYAAGRTTGVVLDVGDGCSHAVPVFEGFAVPNAILRSDIAGRDVTENLALQLKRSGYTFHTSAEMDIVRQIKESLCYVLFNPQRVGSESLNKESTEVVPYTLPDGSSISQLPRVESYHQHFAFCGLIRELRKNVFDRVDCTVLSLSRPALYVCAHQMGNERCRAPEILFNPILVGSEYPGLHELLFTSITRTDLDLRSTLYDHIVLSGGSTFFPGKLSFQYIGFGDRLLNEIRRMAPKDTKIRISAPSNRKTLTWSGGSILASLSTFKTMWITKQEYDEEGSAVLFKKTF